MLQTTYEATKGLLKADTSIGQQERNRILKLIRDGGADASKSETQEPPRLLRRKEAAARLSISLRTLDQWARDGLLTKVTLPGKTRACGFSSVEIDALVTVGSK
jgi:predicted DNA-binding transcriptional regulator AlpA